jgi:TatD DNase family protein
MSCLPASDKGPAVTAPLVDSHCHFCYPELLQQEQSVVERMHAAGVSWALNISTCLDDIEPVLAFAQRHAQVFAAVGIHPDVREARELEVDELLSFAAHPKAIAIGETGLDYYRLQEPLDWQRDRFRRHIRAARACGKPLVIHTRNSADDTLRILREENAHEVGGIFHCFTESLDVAHAAIDLGFLISFSGIVTFKSARTLREVAAQLPDDTILVETDAPFLAPVPNRGKPNEPAWVSHVADELARLRGQSPEHVRRTTSANFFRLFNSLAGVSRTAAEATSA